MLAFTMPCSSEQIVIDGVDMVGMQTSHWYWELRIVLESVNMITTMDTQQKYIHCIIVKVMKKGEILNLMIFIIM